MGPAVTAPPGGLEARAEAPLVTIVVPYYNQGPYLAETLQSLERQTLQAFEVLLVNDGSTDAASLRVLAEMEARWPGLRAIRQPNAGLPAARNRGIREARAPFILPLDADDLLEPTYLEKVAWALVTRPEVGFAYTGIQEFGAGSDQVFYPFDPAGLARMNPLPYCALFRRAVFDRVGGYRETMRLGYEDWDFWLGVVEAGIEGHGIPEPLFLYRRRPDSMLERAVRSHEPLMATLRALHPAYFRRQVVARLLPGGARGTRALLIRIGRRTLPEGIKAHLRPIAYGQQTVRGFARALLRRAGRAGEPAAPAVLAQYGGGEPPALAATIGQAFGGVTSRHAAGRRRNILFLVPWFEVGGADRANLEILGRLDRQRFQPFVIATVPSPQPWRRRFEAWTPEVFALPAFLPGSCFERFVAEFVASRRIDLFQVSNAMHGYAYLRRLRQRSPRLKTLDLLHSVPARGGGYPALSARHFTADLDRHVVVSRHLQAYLIARGVPGAKIRVCPLGVDAREEFNPERYEPGKLRAELRLPPEADVVSFVGRLAKEKRPRLFLDIAEAFLAEAAGAVHFLVVGDGVLRRAVEGRVARSPWRERIHLLGDRSDVAQILRDTAVLVVPSEFEGVARVSYEALAMGVPNLASDVGGQGELIVPACGRLVPRGPDEAARFARALRELLSDRRQLQRMGAAARARILERFDVADFVRALEGVWEELL
jgi:glycosyltransferase involved in cell wall biosynthesis